MVRIVYTLLGAIKNKQNYMIAQDARRYASRHPMAKVIQQLFEKENIELNIQLEEEQLEQQHKQSEE